MFCVSQCSGLCLKAVTPICEIKGRLRRVGDDVGKEIVFTPCCHLHCFVQSWEGERGLLALNARSYPVWILSCPIAQCYLFNPFCIPSGWEEGLFVLRDLCFCKRNYVQ